MSNPKVEIRPARHNGTYSQWVVWCLTGDCQFTRVELYKTTAQSRQREHVRAHRRTAGAARG
jgi:hypothetical protein